MDDRTTPLELTRAELDTLTYALRALLERGDCDSCAPTPLCEEEVDRAEDLRERLGRAAFQMACACRDCGTDTAVADEYYMVEDPVWEASGLAKDEGMLCIGCLEIRIGRELTPDDFTAAAVNHGIFNRSPRLRARLGYAKTVDSGPTSAA